MIVSRTPLRISFFGGGTDLPWFYEKYGGKVISTSINKHIYIGINKIRDFNGIVLKYSSIERVLDASQIQHPILRQVLEEHNVENVDISVSSDIPAGTGLGSSSAFTIGLLNAVNQFLNLEEISERLASMACEIEMIKLGQPIGKQDAYSCATPGLKKIDFLPTGEVVETKLDLNFQEQTYLESALFLVRCGGSRRASDLLGEISKKAKMSTRIDKSLEEMKQITDEVFPYFGKNLEIMASALNETWRIKKSLNESVSNHEVDSTISAGLKAGALGAKLLGAGDAGYVLFIVDPEKSYQFTEFFWDRKIIRVLFDQLGPVVVHLAEDNLWNN